MCKANCVHKMFFFRLAIEDTELQNATWYVRLFNTVFRNPLVVYEEYFPFSV